MKKVLLFFLFGVINVASIYAQPSPPDLTFTLVHEGFGLKPFSREVNVEVEYVEKPQDGSAWAGRPGTMQSYKLIADTTNAPWLTYTVPSCWCTGLRITITHGNDIMQLSLPDDHQERWKLVENVMTRSFTETPEVLPFRSGKYDFADLSNDIYFTALENEIAQRIFDRAAADDAAYIAHAEELRKAVKPTVPALQPKPAVEWTVADHANYWATQPPLKKVKIERINADTITLRFTGRIMLTGDCGSGMPLFGLEMLKDGVWVERIPLEMEQKDCGMGMAEWDDFQLSIPLGYWARHHGGAQLGGPLKGKYRLVFMGGNMQEFRTAVLRL